MPTVKRLILVRAIVLVLALFALACMADDEVPPVEVDKSEACLTCRVVTLGLAERLLPTVAETVEDIRKHNRADRGRVEELAADTMDSTCKLAHIFNNKPLRKRCRSFVDDNFDALLGAVRRWGSDTADFAPLLFNKQLTNQALNDFARRVCVADLRKCKVFADEPAELPKTTYSSQHEPSPIFPPLVSEGNVHPLCTATIHPFVFGEDPRKRGNPNTSDRDVLVYYAFPREPCTARAVFEREKLAAFRNEQSSCVRELADDQGEVHEAFYGTFSALAALLAGSSELTLGVLNARANNPHPPFDSHVEPTLVFYPKNNRLAPYQFKNLREEVSLIELISFCAEAGSEATKNTLRRIVDAINASGSSVLRDLGNQQNAPFYRSKPFQALLQLVGEATSKATGRSVRFLPVDVDGDIPSTQEPANSHSTTAFGVSPDEAEKPKDEL